MSICKQKSCTFREVFPDRKSNVNDAGAQLKGRVLNQKPLEINRPICDHPRNMLKKY